jgi:hypothetical protein
LKNRLAENEKSFGAENKRRKKNCERQHIAIFYYFCMRKNRLIGHHEKKECSFSHFVFTVYGLGLREFIG